VSFENAGRIQAGVLFGEEIAPLATRNSPTPTMREVLAALEREGSPTLAEQAAETEERLRLGSVRLEAPVPDPEKIICLGLNYRDHAAELGQNPPVAPLWFAKFANSLIGSDAEIVLPPAHPDHVDYEAELAVVIGRLTREVDPEHALSHLAGAMAFNDVSARDLQLQNPLWTSGKAVDTFAPCGPTLVTLDEITDIQNLALQTRINGEVLQRGTTAEQIFGVAETVAWLSRTITLVPGDIIATGTPAGVGAAQGRFLRDGDVVEVEVEGLGTVRNPVRAE
jgi:2-keto-4-pentenoate hydratase/2-oxohepta-3-ene-1,7-dioic acid hydratase in catechol pathway